jgi:hypothetical protein
LFGGPVYRDFLNALPLAWSEVNGQSNVVVGQVVGSSIGALSERGLVGNQLSAKLEAWHGGRERLLDEFDVGGPETDIPRPAIPPPGRGRLARFLRRRRPLHSKRALKWLARVLAHADNILDSLTSVVPVAEPLKELKHAIERVADDTADSRSDDA